LLSQLCKAYEIDKRCPEGDPGTHWNVIEKDQASRVKRNAMRLRAELHKVKLDNEECGTVAQIQSANKYPLRGKRLQMLKNIFIF
jgi:hypothetical protein